MSRPAEPAVPRPTVMPVDREAWSRELHLSNFVNSYTQYRDIQTLPGCRRVLIVGPGQGLERVILEWRGYEVTTFDIDETFGPDVLGSVHEMPMFADGQFDAVVVSHVLEHLAVPYLDTALAEIARVGRHALVYLPVHGRPVRLRFTPSVKGIDLSLIVDVSNPLERPDGLTPRYMGGQHFWEVGMRGFRVKDLTKRFERRFEVLRAYRNHEWLHSQNFVLRSKVHAT